ncbi:MAG: 50S ribosomal protein L29 [Pseudomonadota bacterium]
MKSAELRNLTVAELQAKLDEQQKELFNLRFRHATAQLENTSSISVTRHAIARIQTILKEKGA